MEITVDDMDVSGFKNYVKLPIPIKAQKIEHPFTVTTMEGKMSGKKGDYLVVGIKGEKYPCDREIFEETYEEVM